MLLAGSPGLGEPIPTQVIELTTTFDITGGDEIVGFCNFEYQAQLIDAVDNVCHN